MTQDVPQDDPSQNRSLVPMLALLLAVMVSQDVCLLFDEPLGEIFKHFGVKYYDEYNVGEQLSKIYLFLIMLVGLHHYQISQNSDNSGVGIAFFVGGLTLYLGESNRITNDVQAIMAPLIIGTTMFYLHKTRSWAATAFMLLGFFLIAFSSLSDQAHDKHFIGKNLLSEDVRLFWLQIPEEAFEVKGAAFYFISAIIACRDSVSEIVRKDTKGVILLFLASAMLTTGNGWLHFQYTPRGIFLHIGLLTTWAGFAAILAVNKRFTSTYLPLKIINENMFQIFLLGIFVILPAMYRRHRDPVSYLIWLPVMLAFARVLWLNRREGEGGSGRE